VEVKDTEQTDFRAYIKIYILECLKTATALLYDGGNKVKKLKKSKATPLTGRGGL
jgi:hypothetical protein